ncbi:hypothetical protein ACL02T_27160 [Pseudonocardia sp. RS010]|uniref:hypothetical protein n=1 Tax=Pseudonocardia sp. RS010 TaxID=3385979 RepID=UPI0039A3529E
MTGDRPRRLLRRPVIVLTAAVLGLGAAGGLTGMALGGVASASSVSPGSGGSGGSGGSDECGGRHHRWHDDSSDRD